jgi:hypothetical protein
VPFPPTRAELVDALASAAAAVLDTARRSNGRERVRRLSTAAMARRMLDLYRDLLA